MEGCITMGLGYCLREEIHFRGGDVRDRNFDSYEIPRFSWLPEIETILVDNPGLDPQGGGEPPIVNMGAVVANAVFDATGARLNRLPITPSRLKATLSR
jgi:CO/xanthine dehydrogenase Mo-binding subunit